MARKNPRKYDRYTRPIEEVIIQEPAPKSAARVAAEATIAYEDNVQARLRSLEKTVDELQTTLNTLQNVVTFERMRTEATLTRRRK